MKRKPGPGAGTSLARSLLEKVNRRVAALARDSGRDTVRLMEVCGTHTMAISGSGIRRAVDPRLRLLSGPGCPVCVTAQEEIDAAIGLARSREAAVVTFGDMLRVPGNAGSLEQAKARGGDVRVVYSALDALRLAELDPGRQFTFLGVGFETTAPTVAAAVVAAARSGTRNFTVLPMFKLIPPALAAIAGSDRVNVDGLILPGHVSTIIGAGPYRFLAERHALPCCIAGFEATDVLQAILMLLRQLEEGPKVEIQYRRAVRPEGNPAAQRLTAEVFRPVDARWRGLGPVPASGLGFRPAYRGFDARRRFGIRPGRPRRTACRCGDVMLGLIVPPDCRLFGRRCTPEQPFGPCMVSSEGACAAYYKYDRAEERS